MSRDYLDQSHIPYLLDSIADSLVSIAYSLERLSHPTLTVGEPE